MKFSLFAHMERIDEQVSDAALYAQLVALAQQADQGGLHALWTGEHHAMSFTIAPNPFLTLIDLANKTQHLRLGTGTVIAPFWHPIKLAGEAAYADVITEGRIDLGIARGAYSFEYERVMPGLDAWQAGQRMRELVPAVQKLWQGDYTHEGEFYQFPKTSTTPKPLQAGGPPIWVAARDPNSHEFAIANGCNVQVTPLWLGVEEVESLMQKYRDATAKFAREDSKVMLLHHTYVAKDAAEADWAAEQLSKYYCYFGSWFKNERNTHQGMLAELSDDEMAAMTMYSPENMRKNAVIGTADEVVERLQHYKALGYDEFSMWIDSLMPFEAKQASLRRLIDDVIPRV